MTWVDPRTWLAGEKDSAAKRNEIRDALKAIGDPWTSYTPTLTSTGTAPAPSAYAGGYILAGKMCLFRYKVTMSATVGTGTYSIALPVNALVNQFPHAIGQGTVWDSSVGTLYGRTALVAAGVSTFVLHDDAGNRVAQTVPMTFATGDIIAGYGMFEAA